MLREHQTRLTTEASDLDAAAGGLAQAGWACRALAPNLRGMLPPLPWLPPGAPIPPKPACVPDGGAAAVPEDAAEAETPQKGADDAETDRKAGDAEPPETSV